MAGAIGGAEAKLSVRHGERGEKEMYVKGANMLDIITKICFSCNGIRESLRFQKNAVPKL